MRRLALSMVVCLGLIAGCQNAKRNVEPEQSAAMEYGTLQPDLYVTDSGAEPNPLAQLTDDALESEPWETNGLAPPSGQIHIVIKGDTLFKLARTYYSDASRWKDIYEANGSVLSDPDRLHIGQELVIP